MRKTIPAIIAICAFACAGFSQWKPAGDKIKTEWADKVDPQNVLPEYPRPIMERPQWLNLNGLWDYAITKKDAPLPKTFDGKILVPFAIESSLSGVGKTIKADQSLWYERKFQIPEDWKGKNVLLNFGAVDWKAEVFVNGNKIEHTGGYTPFSFNITKNLKDGENSLAVRVWDSTGNGLPRGKQIENPRGIFYTSVSGIWQTVWLEPVSASHISGLKITPDLDSSSFDIKVDSDDKSATATIKVLDNGKVVAQTTAAANKTANIPVKNPKLWWPNSPFLYDLEITLSNKGGEQVDSVKSYAAMRKFSIAKHGRYSGVDFTLNNKKFFTFGPLDQGWWPDGLYTAPTDEALKFDIQRTKDLGFNSIRKHVKVEPARWYTHCDRLGIVVWQDMPSMFGEGNGWQPRGFFQGEERTVSKKFEETYRKEWKEIMESLYSYPCIAIWVPFNEAWGQFKTKEITEWTKSMDPSRLVNSASGGNYFDCGDIVDSHDYGNNSMYLFNNQKVNVVGEYGGIGCAVDGHLWVKDKNWGYGKMRSQEEVTKRFVELTNRFIDMTKYGCFGAIYTQTTDVEIEVNGLFTYDRKVLKVDEEKVREVNQKLSNIFN